MSCKQFLVQTRNTSESRPCIGKYIAMASTSLVHHIIFVKQKHKGYHCAFADTVHRAVCCLALVSAATATLVIDFFNFVVNYLTE